MRDAGNGRVGRPKTEDRNGKPVLRLRFLLDDRCWKLEMEGSGDRRREWKASAQVSHIGSVKSII